MDRPRSLTAIRVAGGDAVELVGDTPGDASRGRFGLPEYAATPGRGTLWARFCLPSTLGEDRKSVV